MFDRSGGIRSSVTWLTVGLLASTLSAAYGQYPGHIDTRKKTGPAPRAIAVLEWTGEPGKPSASRLIPITVFDGESYQLGGLYLARPEPLALDPGTEYILQQAGVPDGLFEVDSAQDVQGYWFGYGAWRSIPPPARLRKLPPARVMPQVVSEANDSRPHFKNRSGTTQGGDGQQGTTSQSGSSSSPGTQSSSPPSSSQTPASDPDRPVLQRRSDSSTSQPDANSSTGTPSNSPASSSQTPAPDPDRPVLERRSDSSTSESGSSSSPGTQSSSPASSGQAPAPDPDRPVLRRRSASSEDASSYTPTGPETAIGGADPNRPHLTHGSANPSGADFEPAKLSGTPLGLQQMIAVSDSTDREPHPFAYPWSDPGDASKMQAQLETLAKKALAPPAPPVKPAPKHHTAATTARHTPKATTPASVLPDLTDERFNAYQLSYSGGATLVFSAQTVGPAGKVKYVTLIAQPDFYGVPKVIFQSVTDDDHLEQTPRMRLVDAVDAKANNRGDLVFELSSTHDRQFAIYQVVGGSVEQVFTTGPLASAQG